MRESDCRGNGEDSMKTAFEPNLDRFSVPMSWETGKEPKTLGTCACGCREKITTGYEYVRYYDHYFVDLFHFRNWLLVNEDFEEVW